MKEFRNTFIRGLALAVPVTILIILFFRVVGFCRRLISPLAERMDIDHILGRATITVFAIFTVLVLTYILGLFMKISVVINFRKRIEDIIVNLVPALHHVKILIGENVDLGNSFNSWIPVIVLVSERYKAAFIVEEDPDLVTLFICRANSLKVGEVVIMKKTDIKQIITVSYAELFRYTKAFGKDVISLIKEKSVPKA